MQWSEQKLKDIQTILSNKCPKCGADLYYKVRTPANTEFLACPNYKQCGFTGINAQGAIMLLRLYILHPPVETGVNDRGTDCPKP